MKKLIFLFLVFAFTSCITSPKEDLVTLQNKFPNSNLIYMINERHWIVEDSSKNLYHISMELNGNIDYKIKLK